MSTDRSSPSSAPAAPAPIVAAARARLAVIGLGYVGLPLAIALARRFDVAGFDIDPARVAELRTGHDHTREVAPAELASTRLMLTDRIQDITGRDVFIVTVPTPVDKTNRPDLTAVRAACRTVGRAMARGAVVIFESTVYPGVTEDICGPALAAESGLVCGRDFFLGYSPERINPGDREHRVECITKVIASQTPAVTALLAELYGAITAGGVFVAKNIRTAEAAKAIENAQRDINIAFINEVAQILGKAGLSVYDVLEAAATKWNFLKFQPGLVGGHCIGVDPYYLAHLAAALGHEPEIILAGRRINDRMGAYIAEQVAARLPAPAATRAPRVLVLGLTFKEDVPDLRNSKVADLVDALRGRAIAVDVHDPLADRAEARTLYGIELLADLGGARDYDAVIAAVAHASYRALTSADLGRLLRTDGLVADVKGIWRSLALPAGARRWQL